MNDASPPFTRTQAVAAISALDGEPDDLVEQLLALAREVRLVGLDVDGVLTDGQLLFLDSGQAGRQFHVRDGQGLRALQAAGITVAWISGRQSRAVEHRAQDLGILELHQGVQDKGPVWAALQARLGVSAQHSAFMGDDLPDLPCLRLSGLSACPSDAVDEVLAESRFVSRQRGGHGAVRDLCDLLLRARQLP
jgi:3-deoxy-D-manno-octulosonate 8-phosphate phosphatase (KDO 8-P phosphatase)